MHEPSVTFGAPPKELRRILVSNVINFVYEHLDAWRDTKQDACTAEKKLNELLCVYLDFKARVDGLFSFHHEQSQVGQRSVDIAAKPVNPLFFACPYGYETIYNNITVFEAKRLPIPKNARKDEYVTGCTKITGGIQRFRLCQHGKEHDTAAMIGYVQKNGFDSNFAIINNCFSRITGCTDGLEWSCEDELKPLEINNSCGKARTESVHSRCDGTTIRLHHLWVEMNQRS